MKVSDRTIEAIRLVINGDAEATSKACSIYRRGVDIEEFFKDFGVSPEAGSRWYMTESCLKALNGSSGLRSAIEKTLHPTNYLGFEHVSLDSNIEYLNQFLEFDGYKIVYAGKIPKIVSIGADIQLDSKELPETLDGNLQSWVDSHFRKCQQKIADQDYSGAITNARSMVEELYIWILKNTDGGYDRKSEGDLVKLGNKVSKRFDMDPKLYDTPLKQIITGLNSQLAGLAGLRNKASDAHGTEYKPGLRHAKLAVNAALTLVNYFSDLCKDKKVLDQELQKKHEEAEASYYEAMAEDMAYDQWRGK